MSDDAITAAITAAVAEADPTSEAATNQPAEETPDVSTEATDDGDAAPDLDAVGDALKAAKPAEEPPAEEDPESAVEDEFAEEHGIRSKEPSGRENRIPYSRVKKITENAVKRATAAIEVERTTLREHNTVYTTRLADIAKTEDIMLGEPERFIEMLKTLPNVGERYAALFGGGAQTAPDLPGAADDPEPEPDGTLPDGTPGYTPKGFKALRAWERRQAIRETEARLSERYKPMETAFKTAQQQRQRQTATTEEINGRIAEAAQWRHFDIYAKDIYAALEADTALAQKNGGKFKYAGPHAMRQVYEDVVFGRLHTDRQKQREEILAELEKAPRQTAAGRPAATTKAPIAEDGDDPVDTAIKQAMRAAGLRK